MRVFAFNTSGLLGLGRAYIPGGGVSSFLCFFFRSCVFLRLGFSKGGAGKKATWSKTKRAGKALGGASWGAVFYRISLGRGPVFGQDGGAGWGTRG